MTPDVLELERQAQELLSPDVYDYYAGGSGREATVRANVAAWQRVRFAPRVLRDVSAVDTSVPGGGLEAGQQAALLRTPVAVAPTAFQALAHPDGELATATGAARAGALYVLSTRCSRRIEDVAAVSAREGGSWWFQVYVMHDRELTAGLVRRAAAAGATALVLTGDTPVVGRKPLFRGEVITGEHFGVNLPPGTDPATAEQAASVTMADIGWLSEVSGGLPVLVKGVLRADDTASCVAAGAAGVIVSNHGGRQLDQAMPTVAALPAVAATAASLGWPVHVDGGVRCGADVLAGLALGAQLVFLGRPVLWALASGGTDGVQDLLEGITDDLAHAMTLAGITSVAEAPSIGVTARDGGFR